MNSKLIYSTFLSLSLLPGVQASKKQPDNVKPNILWITIEDTSPHFIGSYGDKNARTPEIDRLASEGVRFTNAFSTGTVCSPSRTAIITGVKTYKAGTGNHRSKFPVPDFIKGFPWYLQQAGYYTSNNQKTDYNVAGENDYIREAWNESSGKAGWWDRKPGQPFFAVFNYMASHQSRTMTETYEWYRKNIVEKLDKDKQIGDDDFNMPPFYFDSPDMRQQFARVYNSISFTDQQIGNLIGRLENDNLKDSTIIFFFADHGEGMPRGKTNGINYGYRVPFIIWFPEMYSHLSPWGKAGVVTDELIDFTDLAPTLLSLAGADIPDHLEGRPFLGKKRENPAGHLFLASDRCDNGIDMVRSVTDGRYVYSRNFLPFMNEAQYIRYMEIGEVKQLMRNDLKDGKLNTLQKSLFDDRPAEFLFDIRNDVWETRNLATDEAYKPLLQKMRKLMKKEVLKSRDVMFLPEYEIAQVAKDLPPYLYRKNNKQYPLAKIYKAASLSGFRSQDVAAEQAGMLGSSNDVIRYWAILGLRSQSQENIMPYREAILQAVKDEYPPVAVTAAAIAWEFLKDATAREYLTGYCKSDDLHLSLMAINYLLYIDNREPFTDTIREVHKMAGRDYNVRAACMDFLGSLGLVPNTPEYRE